MGDRVIYQCSNNKGEHSSALYLHWGGNDAVAFVKELLKQGVSIGGPWSWVDSGDIWEEDALLDASRSHGDAGIVLVNLDTGQLTCMGGYLKPEYFGDNPPDEDAWRR
jgi:hypothetical protein